MRKPNAHKLAKGSMKDEYKADMSCTEVDITMLSLFARIAVAQELQVKYMEQMMKLVEGTLGRLPKFPRR